MGNARILRHDAAEKGGGALFVERRTGARKHHDVVAHHYATLALCTAGRARLEQRGAWTLEPGDVMIVPPGEPHRMLDADGADFWLLGFCVPCFVDAESAALIEPFERVRAGASGVVRLAPERRDFVERLLREIGERTRRTPSAAVQKSVLTLVMNEIAEHVASPVEGRALGVVSESLAFIHRNCLRPLTSAAVARAIGRTPAYVTTALRLATGLGVNEWIVAGRMAEARRRLLHSDELVDVIAERVGYADVTHFIRMFRRAHGQTPAAWRAQRRASPV